MAKTDWSTYTSIRTGGEICWADGDRVVVAGVDKATYERDAQYITVVYRSVPTEGEVILQLAWDELYGWTKPSDAPMLSQPQDNSPMLSRNHKRK